MGINEDLFTQQRLRSQDFHRRRITNAANARDAQDYVTLAQLRNAVGDSNATFETGSAQRNTSIGFKRAYNFAYTGNLFITSSLCPIITTSINSITEGIVATVEIAPTGANIVINFYQDATLYFSGSILAGNTSATITPPVGTLLSGKRLIVELTAVGTTFPGANFMLNLNTTAV